MISQCITDKSDKLFCKAVRSDYWGAVLLTVELMKAGQKWISAFSFAVDSSIVATANENGIFLRRNVLYLSLRKRTVLSGVAKTKAPNCIQMTSQGAGGLERCGRRSNRWVGGLRGPAASSRWSVTQWSSCLRSLERYSVVQLPPVAGAWLSGPAASSRWSVTQWSSCLQSMERDSVVQLSPVDGAWLSGPAVSSRWSVTQWSSCLQSLERYSVVQLPPVAGAWLSGPAVSSRWSVTQWSSCLQSMERDSVVQLSPVDGAWLSGPAVSSRWSVTQWSSCLQSLERYSVVQLPPVAGAWLSGPAVSSRWSVTQWSSCLQSMERDSVVQRLQSMERDSVVQLSPVDGAWLSGPSSPVDGAWHSGPASPVTGASLSGPAASSRWSVSRGGRWGRARRTSSSWRRRVPPCGCVPARRCSSDCSPWRGGGAGARRRPAGWSPASSARRWWTAPACQRTRPGSRGSTCRPPTTSLLAPCGAQT